MQKTGAWHSFPSANLHVYIWCSCRLARRQKLFNSTEKEDFRSFSVQEKKIHKIQKGHRSRNCPTAQQSSPLMTLARIVPFASVSSVIRRSHKLASEVAKRMNEDIKMEILWRWITTSIQRGFEPRRWEQWNEICLSGLWLGMRPRSLINGVRATYSVDLCSVLFKAEHIFSLKWDHLNHHLEWPWSGGTSPNTKNARHMNFINTICSLIFFLIRTAFEPIVGENVHRPR